MLHPLFSLKYRLDPALPRVYKFLILFTRIMIMFGLSFYFLRNKPPLSYSSFINTPRDVLMPDIYFHLIALAIISCCLVPLPSFMLYCCRSIYFLVEQDKNIKMIETGSNNSKDEKQKLT